MKLPQLVEVLRAHNVEYSANLDSSSTAVIVQDPFASPISNKVRAARKHGIPCVTREWTTLGKCLCDTLDAFEIRHAAQMGSVCDTGLSAEDRSRLQSICGGAYHGTMWSSCKVLVTPDPGSSGPSQANRSKLRFARARGIPCMRVSEFFLCFGPGAGLRPQPRRTAHGRHTDLAPASLPHTLDAADSLPQRSLLLSTLADRGSVYKRNRGSQGMEPLDDVCVFAVTQNPSEQNEISLLVEATGARWASSPTDPQVTHVLLRDEDLTTTDTGSWYNASGAIPCRPGLPFVHVSWLVDCIKSKHRISCLPYRVAVRAGGEGSGEAGRLPVLAFTTLTAQETRRFCEAIKRGKLPAVVQEVVYLPRPHSRGTSSRAVELHETTHLLVPRDRVQQSNKVRLLLQRFIGSSTGVPLKLVDVSWILESSAQGAWLPCDAFSLPWPQASAEIDSGRPSWHTAAAAAATTADHEKQPTLPPPPPSPPMDTSPVPLEAVERKDTAGAASDAAPPERKRPRHDVLSASAASQPHHPSVEPRHVEADKDGEEPQGPDSGSDVSSVTPEHTAAATPTERSTTSLGKANNTMKQTVVVEERKEAAEAQSQLRDLRESQGVVPRSVSADHGSCPHSLNGQYESMPLSLQQRWEDMEALAVDATTTAATAFAKTTTACGGGDRPHVLGEDAGDGIPDNKDGEAMRPPPLFVSLATSPRGSFNPPSSLRTGSPLLPFGVTAPDTARALRCGANAAEAAESQTVFYDHRGSGGGARSHNYSTEEAVTGDRDGALGPSSAAAECEPVTTATTSPLGRVFVEGSLPKHGAFAQSLFRGNPHWCEAESVETCTHFVTGELLATARLLSCLAEGKWVMQPSFLHVVAAAGRRRPAGAPAEVEAHQWTRAAAERLGLPRFAVKLAAGCELQCNLARRSSTPYRPFAKWKVTLTCGGGRFASFKRVLERGGCGHVGSATTEDLVKEAVASSKGRKGGRRGKPNSVSRHSGDGSAHYILSDEADWELAQLQQYTVAVGPNGPQVLLVDYILHYLCTQNACGEQDTVLHRKQRASKPKNHS